MVTGTLPFRARFAARAAPGDGRPSRCARWWFTTPWAPWPTAVGLGHGAFAAERRVGSGTWEAGQVDGRDGTPARPTLRDL